MMSIELDVSRLSSVECTVFAFIHMLTGMKRGSSLTDDDLPRKDVLVYTGCQFNKPSFTGTTRRTMTYRYTS